MSERQMSPSDELATVLTGCAQILDVVKGEWGESWSEWDQSIRDGISSQLKIIYGATPQVTPCDHFWRTVPVGPRWSWFTECEKCKIGAPLKLQAENYDEKAAKLAELKQAYDCGNLGWSEAMQLYWTWHSSAATWKEK